MNILVTKDLTRRFGAFTTVNQLNIAVRKGEIFWIVGTQRCRQDHGDENANHAAVPPVRGRRSWLGKTLPLTPMPSAG